MISKSISSSTQHLVSNSVNMKFRDSSAISVGDVTSIFLITALLLASFSVFAYYAKRKGWIFQVFGKTNLLSSGSEQIRVSEVIRISKHTTVYRIDDGGCDFILIESAINTTVHSASVRGSVGAHR
jgi:hypothetical protein